VRATSQLMLAALLIATTGGFGSTLSVLLTPRLTNYTLMAPYIAFFAIAALAVLVDRMVASRPTWRVDVWTAVLVIGLFDHAVGLEAAVTRRGDVVQESQRVRDMVFELEKRLPAGARVAQFPVQPRPKQQNQMQPFDHLKPYVLSRSLHMMFSPNT